MARRPYTHALADATSSPAAELDGRPAHGDPRPRARAQAGAGRLAGAGGPHGRPALRAAEHAHAHVERERRLRARRAPDGPARQRAAAHARRVGARHRARVLPPRRRDRPADLAATSARRAGRARHGARGQPALPAAPPVPGAGRPDDAARGVRGDRGRRLAYVGDGNNVARSLAILGALAGVEVAVAAPDGFQLEDGLGARAHRRPAARRSPAQTPSTPTSGCR